MFTFEFEPPTESDPCSCCGGRTTALTRFVCQNGDAFAVYFARFSDNHQSRTIEATISIGELGEGASPEQRVAFAMELRSNDAEYQVGLIDADSSHWSGAEIIGRTLDRSEALAHPRIQEIFQLTDQIFAEDIQIRNYLDGTTPVA